MISIDIFIPAHNESSVIAESLSSIRKAFEKNCPLDAFSYRIHVGCNGCTDDTALKARLALADQVYEWSAIGKWQTLYKFSQLSNADYIIYVDAGARWPEDLLTAPFWFSLNLPSTGGLTFSYEPQNLGFIERVYWKLEAALKNFEMKLGGLIAVSGMTMVFHRLSLASSFQFIANHFPNIDWLNDDVILPTTIRFLFPEKTVLLLTSSRIDDLGLQKPSSEKNRRLRMMRGNLQWIKLFVPLFFKKEFRNFSRYKILFLLSRRILKVFWAYIPILLLLFILALLFCFQGLILLSTTILYITFIALLLINSKFRVSLFASLRAPLDLVFWDEKKKSRWN